MLYVSLVFLDFYGHPMLLILHGELVILEHMHMDLVKLRHIRPMAQIAVTTLSPLRCLSTVLGM